MRFCPPCHRYLNGAFSCAGCGADARTLPEVPTPADPPRPRVTMRPLPTRPETRVLRAGRPHVPVSHARRPMRQAGARKVAPALLAAGLGFAAMSAVAGAGANTGQASAAGGSLPSTSGPLLGLPPGVDAPQSPTIGGYGTAPGLTAAQSPDTAPVAAVADATPGDGPSGVPTGLLTGWPTPALPGGSLPTGSAGGGNPTPLPSRVPTPVQPTPVQPTPAPTGPASPTYIPSLPTPGVTVPSGTPGTDCAIQLLIVCIG
ncbi:hypothetical protein [Streptacidiphilus fuscans]|uniref:Uncharacterized protein n=1 Tax=Streptacidiphilus fuscans TaxID=2789292 RepID=A0A931FCG2_9ACTN|nr:hypothetical protein [Streptacidiphilus fuscans]MBF9069707.1 hypothetical protein [Streptacidiphilus fuscans]